MNADGTPDIIQNVFTRANNGMRVDWSDKVLGSPRAEWPNGQAPGTDTVKITGQCEDLQLKLGTVYAWKENCLDLNNKVKKIRVTADKWVTNGCIYPFTIKGGATDIGIYGKLEGHGKECDIDAGNNSQQSRDWVTNWELGLISTDGSPIVVRCLSAETPRLVPGTGPYKFIFPDPRKWYHCRFLINIILNFIRLGWL